jgi:hypothetical protein
LVLNVFCFFQGSIGLAMRFAQKSHGQIELFVVA